ncbi:3-isopropylmalate dehydrogenase [Candidatus Peregrinibacteria bacterium]|nr:MAG: 3-isopropylmalate dehydrogenase [Candidatus Peregrinibacteria bacterium]
MQKTIAVLPGDGIGPEVMNQAIRILKKIEMEFQHEFNLIFRHVGGAAIDHFGEPLPAKTREACEQSDAILFGSVGGQKWDHLPAEKRPETGALLPLRKHFDLFANLRPAGVSKTLSAFSPLKESIIGEGFSYLVVRELTGDVYFGEKEGDGKTFASDLMIYKREEIERIAKVAFSAAQKRKGKVTNVDKANVLQTSKFWRTIVEEVHQNMFPDVALEHLYIDNATMQILTRPRDFDVFLTGNLFGDILSDESAQISGSIGMQASASVNEKGFGLFEPMGGSAPNIAGKDIANPIAQIRSVAMMLELGFGLLEEAKAIEHAIDETLIEGFRTVDIFQEGDKKVGTEEMGIELEKRISRT